MFRWLSNRGDTFSSLSSLDFRYDLTFVRATPDLKYMSRVGLTLANSMTRRDDGGNH